MIAPMGPSFGVGLDPEEAVTQIANLVRNGHIQSFGTFSVAVYDTAWVSMVHKIVDGRIVWLFEECFHYLLDQQRDDGTWQTSAAPIDGILNTAAGLLSFLTRLQLSDEQQSRFNQLQPRAQKAEQGLRSLLRQWDVETTDAVGFEILVPSLLRQIANLGVHFEYPGSAQLTELNRKKMGRFRPEFAYSDKLLTLHHSLEGLVGMIDFDKVRHHCNPTLGIFGSPASTAAYLIHSSIWDDGAESYLIQTLRANGGSAVPSAFPTYLFEVSWALSTMLDPSVLSKPIAMEDAEVLSAFFTQVLDSQQGVVGFAAGALEDADDTARVLLTLQRLHRPYENKSMISKFESEGCFRTYEIESNPSFSANCNVLLTLLEHDLIETNTAQIEKLLGFLLDLWDSGKANDKWNRSPYYVFMLFADVLIHVLKRYDGGDFGNVSQPLVLQRVPLAICRILSEVILKQSENGSWGSSLQATSYAVITVAYCLVLPWSPEMKATLTTSLERGQHYMVSNVQHVSDDENLWIEKVTYTSKVLQSIYHISALHIRPKHLKWNAAIASKFVVPENHALKTKALLSKLPLFQERPIPCIELALIEAMNLSSRLCESRLMVFPRDQMPVTADKYLKFIPVLWATANQVGGNTLPLALIWEMTLQSMFIYQVDEYMESVVAGLSNTELLLLDRDVQMSCNALSSATCQSMTYKICTISIDDNKSNPTLSAPSSQITTVKTTLNKYINYVNRHPAIVHLSETARNELNLEIYDFIHAHIMQNVLNRQLKVERSCPPRPSDHAVRNTWIDYAGWVRTLGANTTSCPMAFRLFTILTNHYTLSPQRSSFRQQPTIKYCLDTLGRHLAIMCRQYNDIGSVNRDLEEDNLNSLDFSLFEASDDSEECALKESKSQLMEMAQIERSCVAITISKLKQLLPRKDSFVEQIQVFVDVTDLFGQMYIIKDHSSRVQQTV